MSALGIINFWKVPLVGISTRNAEINESLFCWFGYPVHSIINLDVAHGVTSLLVDAKSYSFELTIIFTAGICLSFLLICFNELRFEILINLFLVLLPLDAFFVLVVVGPGPLHYISVVLLVMTLWVLLLHLLELFIFI